MKKKLLLSRISISLGVTAVAVLVAEAVYRLSVFGLDGFSPSQMNSVEVMGTRKFLIPSPHEEIRYLHTPDLDDTFKLKEFRTNSHGWRDEEVPFAKPQGTWRAAVIGDSFTMGSGVAIEKVFHSLLEWKFEAESPELDVQFLNFGVGGYAMRDYLGVLDHYALDYEPDLILVGLTENDQYRLGSPLAGRLVEPGGIPPFYRLHVLDAVRKRLRARPAGSPEEDRKGGANRRREAEQEDALHMRDAITSLRAAAEKAGVPIAIVYLNMRQDVVATRAGELFAQFAREEGVPFLSTTSLFGRRRMSDFIIFKGDHHPNDEANWMFAEAIHDFLVEEGLAPE